MKQLDYHRNSKNIERWDSTLCPEAIVTLVPVWKQDVTKRGILKSLVSHVLNLKSGIKLIYDKIRYTYCVTNEFDQLLRLKTWETRLFKMPHLETPRFQMGTRIFKSCL